MAKPTKYAPYLCVAFSILAIIGILIGLIFKLPLVIIILLLPAAIYEVYRTEGASTKISSIILLITLVAEFVLIVFKINFNLATYLNRDSQYIAGYLVPLGDVKVLGPTLMAVLSVILFVRTYGVYTKWLAVVIFITSFALVYSIDPVAFNDLLKRGVDIILNRVSY